MLFWNYNPLFPVEMMNFILTLGFNFIYNSQYPGGKTNH